MRRPIILGTNRSFTVDLEREPLQTIRGQEAPRGPRDLLYRTWLGHPLHAALFLFYDIIPLPRLQLLILVNQRLELLFARRQLLVHLIIHAAPSAG